MDKNNLENDINKNNSENINISLSAGGNKIKYYESSDNNCIFEILDDGKDYSYEKETAKEIKLQSKGSIEKKILGNTNVNNEYVEDKRYNISKNNENYDKFKEKQIYGEIVVTSILDIGEQEYLQGVKINLYKINGLSPVLIESKITDKDGRVVFSKIGEGAYRVIEIIDKRYFEKPKYINWNEITIDSKNNKQNLAVVNRIKKFATKNRKPNI